MREFLNYAEKPTDYTEINDKSAEELLNEIILNRNDIKRLIKNTQTILSYFECKLENKYGNNFKKGIRITEDYRVDIVKRGKYFWMDFENIVK